jgi:hypothetical protein
MIDVTDSVAHDRQCIRQGASAANDGDGPKHIARPEGTKVFPQNGGAAAAREP